MERRIFLTIATGGFLAAPLVAGAQRWKMYRVGFFSGGLASRTVWIDFMRVCVNEARQLIRTLSSMNTP